MQLIPHFSLEKLIASDRRAPRDQERPSLSAHAQSTHPREGARVRRWSTKCSRASCPNQLKGRHGVLPGRFLAVFRLALLSHRNRRQRAGVMLLTMRGRGERYQTVSVETGHVHKLSRFYSRTSGEKYQLDVREIRAGFVAADTAYLGEMADGECSRRWMTARAGNAARHGTAGITACPNGTIVVVRRPAPEHGRDALTRRLASGEMPGRRRPVALIRRYC